MSALRSKILRLALAVHVSACVLAFVFASPALAAPWWHIASETVPRNLPPGGEGEIMLVVSNLGDTPIEGGKEQVTITDKLPTGLEAITIAGQVMNHIPVECALATLTCTFKGDLYPYEQTTVTIRVKASAGAGASLSDQASVEGGGAAKATRALTIPVSGEPAGFGVEDYELAPFNENGSPATQAGAHPFQLTTTLALNQVVLQGFGGRQPVELPKDLGFHLPPGLVGNPNAVAQCTMADFFALVFETNLCPPSTVVGVASVTADEPKALKVFTKTVPVFNLVPAQGEPARFGLEVAGKVPIVIDTSVRSGQDYGVDVSVEDATQTAGLLSSQVTFWGVPGDPRHNIARGWECVAGGAFAAQVGKPCPGSSELPEAPFLTLPGSCASDPQAEPVVFSMEADSWAQPGSFLGAEYEWMSETGQALGFEECSQLPFSPAIDVTPEQHTAATPTGLSVDLKVPQQSTLEANEPAEADVRDTTVTLPQGVELNPSAATGLEACSEPQIGFEGFGVGGMQKFSSTRPTPEEPLCPNASKLGTVEIETPLLAHKLEGALFLAEPAPNGEGAKNPFNSLVALYLIAEDPVSGVLVKLAGEGTLDEATGQVSTTFRGAPQVPFSDLKIHLFDGPRASLSTPARCGAYATEALFTPWSSPAPVGAGSPADEFQVTSGAGGSSCPAGALPFAPGMVAQSTNTHAGAFTDFDLELTRPDGDQALAGVTVSLPSGIAALLSKVALCDEAQAASDSCPAESLIGEATVLAGLGPEPYLQSGGKVYITGPYGGAPFGLEIVTPADAGPFDLGYVTVRSKLYINPENASVTIVSDALPTQIKGIPLQLKRVLVNVNRREFEFNPTSCNRMTIGGTIYGSEGASAPASSPFQAGGCGSLPFRPALSASAAGHGSKADGTRFDVTVTSGGTNSGGVAQAGIAKVDLQLPKQLSSRLPTLQKACPEAAFNANPAACDEGSVIGYATIRTPVLKNPLSGPAYLVSHGNAAFPDVEFLLQGEGIKLILDGKTNIKNGVTYSKFESTPDAPFTVFETVLPAGPHGVLTPNVAEAKKFSLCGESLAMPTTITGQNGAVVEQKTKIAISGCGEVKSATVKKLTLMQQLRRALLACRHRYKLSNNKRQRCESQAHTRLAQLALAACRHQHKHTSKQRLACEQAARKRFKPAAHKSRP